MGDDKQLSFAAVFRIVAFVFASVFLIVSGIGAVIATIWWPEALGIWAILLFFFSLFMAWELLRAGLLWIRNRIFPL